MHAGESWDEQLLLTTLKVVETAKTSNNKQPDWNYVERFVASSDHPRVIDIPAHIKFLKMGRW